MQDPAQSLLSKNPLDGSATIAVIIREEMDAGLYNAALDGLVSVIERYRDSLTSQITTTGNTVLHIHVGAPASKDGNPTIQFIQTVLEYEGSLLLHKNDNDEIPLHLAARFKHVDAVEAFISKARGISVGRLREMLMMTDRNQDSALHHAVRSNNVKIVELLLGADSDCPYGRNVQDRTPLYLAAERKYPALVATILDACVSPAYEGPLGRTALHAAVLWEDEGMVEKILTKNDALVRSQDDESQTPLHYAVGSKRRRKNSKILTILLQYDDTSQSAVYIQDKEGRTALHLAVVYGDVHQIKALLDHKPECSEIRDKMGRTPFHYVVKSSSRQTIRYLFSNRILKKLINEQDQQGNTPLHLLSKSFSVSSHYHFVCSNAFQSDKDADFMVYNNENQTAGDILPIQRSIFPFIVNKLPKSIYRLAHRDVPAPFQEPDTSQLTRSQEEHKETRLHRLKKSSEAHLVVATLIATVSFAAGITVPGGFNQNLGEAQGMALLTKQTAFRAFMVSNTLALAFSSTAILYHFYIYLLEEPKMVVDDYIISMNITAISLGAMIVAFMAGTYSTTSQSASLVNTALALVAIVIYFFGMAPVCNILSFCNGVTVRRFVM